MAEGGMWTAARKTRRPERVSRFVPVSFRHLRGIDVSTQRRWMRVPTWLWILIIVLVVLALFGGVGYTRR